MTVGETLTASSLGPASGGKEANDNRSGGKVVAQAGGGAGGPSNEVGHAVQAMNPNMNMVTSKIGQELVTSLHLIKDIRRLEKYQRDFFLKVKESLSHVQVLLDHQLMDTAWSDNLIDCEENLLRVSNHMQQSGMQANNAQQMAELYGILLHDREKLNHRFQELSVKSLLREFVVNSRQLLDINAVRIAAEAILKNEKPIPAQGDHSSKSFPYIFICYRICYSFLALFTVPVDHTFFLANFCTASLASSTSGQFLPQSKQGNQGVYNQQQRYDSTKKINGNALPPPPGVNAPSQPQTSSPQQQQIAMKVRPTSGQPQQAQDMNGIALTDALNSGNATSGNTGAAGSSGQNYSGMYNDSDNYLPPNVVAPGGPGGGGGGGGSGGGGGHRDMSNGLYGQHELVAAISQITAEPPTAVGQQPQQQNKAYNKGKKLWSAETAGGSTETGGNAGNAKMNDSEPAKGPPRGFGGGGRPPSGGQGGVPRSGRYSGGQNNEMNLANDGAASDSLSSTSEEVGATSSVTAPMTGEIGDNGKPLSFARIASLNLEKQALQARQAAAAAAAAAAASGGKAGGAASSTTNANATMANDAMIMSTAAAAASMNNSNLQAAAAAAAASMANMSMAEAAAVAAAQQGMAPPYSNHPMAMAMAAQQAAQQQQQQQQQQTMPMIQLPPSNNPRFFFDIAMDGKRLGRAIIEVQATLAPKMAQNFHMLVTSEKGFGYRGCQFFQAWRNESVICGDWEHNSGRGGRAAIEDGPLFTPDETKLPCIRGAVGMRRMSKKHSSLNQVQFIIFCRNRICAF